MARARCGDALRPRHLPAQASAQPGAVQLLFPPAVDASLTWSAGLAGALSPPRRLGGASLGGIVSVPFIPARPTTFSLPCSLD